MASASEWSLESKAKQIPDTRSTRMTSRTFSSKTRTLPRQQRVAGRAQQALAGAHGGDSRSSGDRSHLEIVLAHAEALFDLPQSAAVFPEIVVRHLQWRRNPRHQQANGLRLTEASGGDESLSGGRPGRIEDSPMRTGG